MNTYELAARQKKADALVAEVRRQTLRVVRELDDAGWANLARHAGVNPPSGDETKQMVIAELERIQDPAA